MDEMKPVFVVAPAPATEFDEALAAAGVQVVGRSDSRSYSCRSRGYSGGAGVGAG